MIVYAFKHASCAYEGVDLMTLHATKAGAWQALRRHVWDEAVERRDSDLRYGNDRGRVWQRYSRSWVQAMEVLS